MKRLFYTLIFISGSWYSTAQVGIGTNTPDNSAMLEVQSTERGILFPRMTTAQRTSIAAPATGLYVFDTNTNSLWYYNGTLWINTTAEASFGDVKSGFQTADHSGWIILDGRALNTLSANQQAVAISLGFTTNLPDASSAYLVQNGSGMGALSGANTTTLTQANLPNVTFSGTAASAGGHNHGGATGSAGAHNHTGTTSTNGSHNHSGTTTTNGDHSHLLNMVSKDNGDFSNANGQFPTGDANKFNGGWHWISTENSGNHFHSLNINSAGDHSHTLNINAVSDHSHSISTDGAHTHSVTVSSGGSAIPINIAPRSMSVNMFVYLGQ